MKRGSSLRAIKDALAFDTYNSGFRHERDLCTREVLQTRFGIADATVRRIGEIVHDIDLKEDCYRTRTSSPLPRWSRDCAPAAFAVAVEKDPEHWRTNMMQRVLTGAVVMLALTGAATTAQETPADYQQVLTTLGKTGDFKDNVLKINLPRNDVKVTVAGIDTPTPFGFGGWIALTKASDGNQVLMGDLVLLDSEVNPVMSAVLDNGFDVTALHNHFFRDEPHMFYMHVHGHGAAPDLARRIKPAIDLIGKGRAAVPQTSTSQLDGAKLAQIVGRPGEQTGAVYKITIGRDDLKMTEMGALINARMGLNTWAAFTGTNEKAAIAGDVAMLESEVTPVLKALRQHGLEVVAIHHHMTSDRPMVIFLHYWGTGSAASLATGFKAALNELGKHGGAATSSK